MSNSTNNDDREMKFNSFYGGDDGETMVKVLWGYLKYFDGNQNILYKEYRTVMGSCNISYGDHHRAFTRLRAK